MQSAGYRSPTPTDERAHSRGWLALISGAPIAFDRVCRHDNRWPQYFELLAQVAKMPEAAERNVLLERLTRPEKSASALGARMNRAVGLVRQALATGGRALGSLEDDVSNAADQLLLIAIGASTPLPEPLKRSAAVTTPILLVRDGVAEDPMESHVADLTLWVVDALRRPRIEIHPAPASYLLYLDPDFKRGLRCVEQAIERRLVGTHQDDLPVLLWDIHPRRHNGRSPATCGLAGESASASFALTGLWLLRERLAHDVRHELMLAEPWHMAVSAAVSGDGDSLHAVEHLAYKLQALCDASGPYRRIHQVFAHFEQVHGSYQVAEIQGVKSLSELITRAAAATGGRMTASQRRLHDELLTTGHHTLSEAEMAEVAATAPTSLRTYLLFRYARWAIAAWRLDRWFVRLHLSRLSGRKQEDHELGEQDFHSLESLIRSCPQANGFVLVGEPGSGKTTLLGRWELDRTTEALLALGLGQGLPEVCIWVNLGEYPIGLSTVRGKAEALRAAAGDPAAQQRAHALVTPVDWLGKVCTVSAETCIQ